MANNRKQKNTSTTLIHKSNPLNPEKSHPERRKHIRYQEIENILFLNQDTLAEVIDISNDGVACHCQINCENIASELININLLNSDTGIIVQDLKGRLVRSSYQQSESLSPIYNFSIEFVDLTKDQSKQLNNFIHVAISGSSCGKGWCPWKAKA